MIESPELRRWRGGYYRAHVLLMARRFGEARRTLEELMREGPTARAVAGTPAMEVKLLLQLAYGRVMLAVDPAGARELLTDIDATLDDSSLAGEGPALDRVADALAVPLSRVGNYKRAIELGARSLHRARAPEARADALVRLSRLRIACGFDKECAARLASPRGMSLAVESHKLYETASHHADEAIALWRDLRDTDAYLVRILYGQAQLAHADVRSACLATYMRERGADARLSASESAADAVAQASRETPGILEKDRIARFGIVGICLAARATLASQRGEDNAQPLARRSRDVLEFAHRSATGTLDSAQLAVAYGEALSLLGKGEEARVVFEDAATHGSACRGGTDACVRLLFEQAAASD